MKGLGEISTSKKVTVIEQHDETENKEWCGSDKDPKIREPDHSREDMGAAEKETKTESAIVPVFAFMSEGAGIAPHDDIENVDPTKEER